MLLEEAERAAEEAEQAVVQLCDRNGTAGWLPRVTRRRMT